ncbi:hypothetical protein ACIRNI_28445 [Streptomyces sp. NPDC093546]|uniref:hypothetical protein n=1 Tax=Streptomyces sp. NPDC093546 TaxID=3366040 RepID=UPI003812FF06
MSVWCTGGGSTASVRDAPPRWDLASEEAERQALLELTRACTATLISDKPLSA